MSDLRSDLLRRVRDNLHDGASHLARVALDSLGEYASVPAEDVTDLRQELLAFADELGAVRPSMTAIHNLVARWQQGVAEYEGDEAGLRAYALEQARAVRNWADAATDATVRTALGRIGAHRKLMTHSISSTVTRILTRVPRNGMETIVTESRPGLEGWNLASALAQDGIRVTYITDAQAGLFVGDADMVLFGADAILADGAVVNKAGTRLIALAAREAGVPVYVCAESFKCTRQTAAEVVIEEKSGSELRPPPVPGIRARNLYFEVTPAELITDWLCNEPLAERFGR
ncbi:MAG TPA: translation initiation factor eIF-2B [Pseudomonadales bacterium]|nr:translation initiation factor eIF-2B [Pseudomonadales bacterium]